MKKPENLPANYQNNPFFVATDGLDRLFKKAQSIGILFAIVSALGFLGSLPGPFDSRTDSGAKVEQAADTPWTLPVEAWAMIGLIGLVVLISIIVIGIILRGISDFTSAKLAKGEAATLSEAFRAVFANFWSYTWMNIIAGVKILLWSLLLVVPGIIMAIRYSLAGVSFFEADKRGNAAIKDSLALTKGATITTFASQSLLNFITLGLIQPLLTPGTNAMLYGQLRPLTDSNTDKPRAHALSWITLVGLILLILLTMAGVLLLMWAAANYYEATINP